VRPDSRSRWFDTLFIRDPSLTCLQTKMVRTSGRCVGPTPTNDTSPRRLPSGRPTHVGDDWCSIVVPWVAISLALGFLLVRRGRALSEGLAYRCVVPPSALLPSVTAGTQLH
jgi:hypothetical protein